MHVYSRAWRDARICMHAFSLNAKRKLQPISFDCTESRANWIFGPTHPHLLQTIELGGNPWLLLFRKDFSESVSGQLRSRELSLMDRGIVWGHNKREKFAVSRRRHFCTDSLWVDSYLTLVLRTWLSKETLAPLSDEIYSDAWVKSLLGTQL